MSTTDARIQTRTDFDTHGVSDCPGDSTVDRSVQDSVPTQDWLSRGLKSPAGRGWDGEPASDTEINANLAQHGVSLRPPPGKENWPAGWRPGDEPMRYECGRDSDPFARVRAFGPEQRVRFLDCLAGNGNVRAAAARVGVSHETVYRARRRHADFAAAWEVAMVHARARGEAELATRAIDGVEVPVLVRGEHVASWRKHDARYLFAHLARLDRRAEENPQAVARAGEFEHMLSAMLGHTIPEDMAEAARQMPESDPAAPEGAALPTRNGYAAHMMGNALDKLADEREDAGEHLTADAENAVVAVAEADAEAAWDRWHEEGAALLDRVLAEGDAGEGRGAQAGLEKPARDCVTSVNTPSSPDATGKANHPPHGGKADFAAPGKHPSNDETGASFRRSPEIGFTPKTPRSAPPAKPLSVRKRRRLRGKSRRASPSRRPS